MNDSSNSRLVDVDALTEALVRFTKQRDWGQFHSPKNLVMALAGEVGELSEIFQWMSEAQSRQAGVDAATAAHVRDELADVLMYVVMLASELGVDLDGAVRNKLAANALKYPVDKAHGVSKKYTEL